MTKSIASGPALAQEYPVLISLSLIFSYSGKSLVEVLHNPLTPVVNKSQSELVWDKEFTQLYIPLFEFLLQQKIKISVIITGHFLDIAAQHYPEFIQILHKMIAKKLIYIIPDAYWASSHLSMYYFDWWQDEIAGTIERIKAYLSIPVQAVFIPLIYRQLPLEKLITRYNIDQYVSILAEKKGGMSSMLLKEFRRFHGGRVNWIKNLEHTAIRFYWYPANHYFDLMAVKYQQDMQLVRKSIGLEIALIFTKSQIVQSKSKKTSSIRIQEERNWSRYRNLDKAVFRLWEYATYMLGKEHAEVDTIDDDPLMRNLFYSMNRDFLFYLGYDNYKKKHLLPFSSPYEAFVHIQNTIIQLEILLKERES